jgi:hypothetical protein
MALLGGSAASQESTLVIFGDKMHLGKIAENNGGKD